MDSNYLYDFGWLFLYISAFGISDFLVKKFIKSDSIYVYYYIIIGIIGLYLLSNNSK